MLNYQTGVLFVINGMMALAFAFIVPIMSLFLVSELLAEPFYIGIYTTLSSLISVVVSQKLTGLLDKGASSRLLLVISIFAIVIAALGFAVSSRFWHALLIGCTIIPIGSSSLPILLAIIRKYADSTGKDSAKLNAQMRSSVSLLWVVGPPLAFMSVGNLGFQWNFYLAAIISLLAILLILLFFKMPKTASDVEADDATDKKLPKQVWTLAAVMFLGNVASLSYINTIPLYMTKELGMSASYPGFLMGLAAAIEIPVMLLCVNWAKKFGKTQVLKFGLCLGLIFFLGIYLASSMVAFCFLQIINGLFFGIFAGLGITIMQDYAPNSVGRVSAVYANAMLLGSMVGASGMGVVSQYYGFKASLLFCMAVSFLSILLLDIFERIFLKAEKSVLSD